VWKDCLIFKRVNVFPSGYNAANDSPHQKVVEEGVTNEIEYTLET